MTAGFYSWLRDKRKDDDALAKCIGDVVDKLEATSTSGDSPGILLGKIQSGKTRAFVGVIARAFDQGYDVAVVFTKGTRTLSMQTVTRLAYDFEKFVDDDQLLVFDIMQPPGRLTRGEQGRKLVIVAKKQIKNLERILDFFDRQYPLLKSKKVLIVDDEADLASVRFVRPRNRPDDLEQGKIAEKIDEMRRLVTAVAYLQVTATPYSLYLQHRTMRRLCSSPKDQRLRRCCPYTVDMLAAMTISWHLQITIPDHFFLLRCHKKNRTAYVGLMLGPLSQRAS
jgi:hypothetical protein